jgi:hypothetical protein
MGGDNLQLSGIDEVNKNKARRAEVRGGVHAEFRLSDQRIELLSNRASVR